jgi:D-sedoheptulose 7-phosphate isomerase
MTAPSDAELAGLVARKHAESAAAQERLFAGAAAPLAACARAMAAAFDAGGRLWTMGNGGSACDAQHVAVEFMHPVFEKRPALPATALAVDTALLTAIGNDDDFAMAFARQLRTLGRAGDVALGISTSGMAANVIRGLKVARQLGMVTVGFTGRDGGKLVEVCDHLFVAPSFSIHRIQECHVALLHLLWDLVHVVRGQEDVL